MQVALHGLEYFLHALTNMTILKTTAYELLSCVSTSLRFMNSELTQQLRKGRVAIGELCLVREPSSCLSMLSCINTDDYIVIRYGSLHIQENQRHHLTVNSMHELVGSIKQLACTTPRVLGIIDTVNMLSGLRVRELEQLVSNLLERNFVVITNCPNLTPLATQVIDL